MGIIMSIETYLKTIDENGKSLIKPIISYIETNYSQAVFDDKYSEKTYIPTWRRGEKYVAIAARKKYISVYFGSEQAINTVRLSINSPGITVRKGCVNISFAAKEFPYKAIYQGIDICLK